jgi:hypothetical protein
MDDTFMTGSPGALRPSTAAANDAMHKLVGTAKMPSRRHARISGEQEAQATQEMD